MAQKTGKLLLDVLAGESPWPPPLWLMRQAGRYLPEYRAVRAEAGSFLDLCFSPKHACEVTLQPIRRFGFDAAILFSDILVIPHAMGRYVGFQNGEGPVLEPLNGQDDVAKLKDDMIEKSLAPVYEAVSEIAAKLPKETTFIGFCGGPWTVATYMIAGRGKDEQMAAKAWAYGQPELLDALIAKLVRASVQHLLAQLRAGAEVVQIFETWAGALDAEAFDRFVVKPTRQIVDEVRLALPGARIIGFPRGVGSAISHYIAGTGGDAVGFDWSVDPQLIAKDVKVPLQGNLDPLRLVEGREAIDIGLQRLLPAMRGRPYIFNLGHGITPHAKIENVEYLIDRVRGS